MDLRNKILSLLPQPEYRAQLISGWQNTNDIIKAITIQHKQNLTAAEKIKHLFRGNNEKDTAKNIFNFLKNEIQYKIESGDKQTTKTLQRFIADGYGDCKHLSLFANTILQQCGYKVYYRFAGYKNKGTLQHVYSYLPKTDIVLDAVMPSFDTEKKTTNKKDLYMSLYQLSGTNDEVNGISFSKAKDKVKTIAAKTSPIVKKVVNKIPDATKKLAQGTKTISLAIPRTAFVAITLLNVHNIAADLKKLMLKKGDMEALKWWVDLGGNRTDLINAINKGAVKKRIFGIDEETDAYNEVYGGYSGEEIGLVVAATTTASIASAAPILLKLKDILTKAGINTKDIIEVANKAKTTFEGVTGKKITDVIFKKDTGLQSTTEQINETDIKDTSLADANKIVTAAASNATGVDKETLKDIAEETAAEEKDTTVKKDLTGKKPFTADIKGFFIKNKKTIMLVGGLGIGALILKNILKNK